ncbi:hypothetical protein CRENBAI_011085 [Crenichthys baileyi]|uniref:Secreted protein n=1 Tax=Crenichthys baileyi TaxID=28760 RepID=A0AAV9QQ22_9TELE
MSWSGGFLLGALWLSGMRQLCPELGPLVLCCSWVLRPSTLLTTLQHKHLFLKIHSPSPTHDTSFYLYEDFARAPHPISKGVPGHPTEEAHFSRLYPGSRSFGHDPKVHGHR